jgi:hypothetical protein
MKYRKAETWESKSTIFLTSVGFPEGRTVPSGQQQAAGIDPNRLARLSYIYGQWANSDQVRALIGPFPGGGSIVATPIQATNNTADALPLLSLTTDAESAAGAESLNSRTVRALRQFVEDEQRRAGVPDQTRVQLALLNAPTRATLAQSRPMTLPIVVLFLTICGAVAVAYILENLRLARSGRLLASVQPGTQVNGHNRAAEPADDDVEARADLVRAN